MTTKRDREREYERRRYQKRLERAHRRRRRHQVIALWVVGALVLAGVVTTAVLSGSTPATAHSAAPRTPTATPTATATAPAASLAQDRTWTGSIQLAQGTLGIELDGKAAPQAVASFTQLAAKGFFDGTTCHRLATDIKVLQCGDPTGTGTGGPGYTFGPIENAPADGVYRAGTIAMARVSGDASSQGSQFFIVYADTTIPADAAGGYTVFGTVTSGLDVVQAIAAAGTKSGTQTPASPVTIEKVETK